MDLDISYIGSLCCINEKYLFVLDINRSEISIYDVDESSFELVAKYLVQSVFQMACNAKVCVTYSISGKMGQYRVLKAPIIIKSEHLLWKSEQHDFSICNDMYYAILFNTHNHQNQIGVLIFNGVERNIGAEFLAI